MACSALSRRIMESPRRATGPISVQITQYWLRQPHFPPKHWRVVCSIQMRRSKTNGWQIRLCLSRCHQPNLVTDVRHDQHLRSLPATTTAIPEPYRSSKRRGGRAINARAKELWCQGQGSVNTRWKLLQHRYLPKTEYVAKYASKEAADEAGVESDDDDDMSSVGSFGDDEDEQPAGQMEEV